jgi:predicted RecB family nuclease
LRAKLIVKIAEDMDDLVFKFNDVFRVMEKQIENSFNSATFEKYMGFVEYDEELCEQTSQLIMDAWMMVMMQAQGYQAIREEGKKLAERLNNKTQEHRDQIRSLHVQYDLVYFE